MRISIVGWYGKKNVGDDAFQVVFSDFFKDHQVEFVTPPNRCNNPDVVILGGGAVASPFYIDTLPDCPRYAIGLDLAFDSEADLLGKAGFRKICVRTKKDVDLLLPKVNCPVQSIPDLAFYLKRTGKSILSKYKKTDRPALGVLVTDYVNPAIDRNMPWVAQRALDFKVKLAKELDHLYMQGFEIILIPCSTGGYGDDRRINLDLAAFMEYEPVNILDTIGPQDMIDLVAECYRAICMRFHAHVFAMIAETPFASIEFTRKVNSLLEENQMLHCIGGTYDKKSTFDFSNLSNVLNCESESQILWARSQTYQSTLDQFRQELLAVFGN